MAEIAAQSAATIATTPNHLETTEETMPLPLGLAKLVRHYAGEVAVQRVLSRHGPQSRCTASPMPPHARSLLCRRLTC